MDYINLIHRKMGVPEKLSNLVHRISLEMCYSDYDFFNTAFITSVPVGKDLNNIHKEFFIWLLVDKDFGVINFATSDIGKMAIKDVADLLEKSLTNPVDRIKFLLSAKAARTVAANSFPPEFFPFFHGFPATCAIATAVCIAFGSVEAVNAAALVHGRGFYKRMFQKILVLLEA